MIIAVAKRVLKVDLHGYDVLTALDLALTRVREAYENGYQEVELVHGSASVTTPVDEGRGRIKSELRRMFDAGRFDAWADRSRSWPKASSLLLTLRANPRPARDRWSAEPRRRHR
jgi:hypothetical protein